MNTGCQAAITPASGQTPRVGRHPRPALSSRLHGAAVGLLATLSVLLAGPALAVTAVEPPPEAVESQPLLLDAELGLAEVLAMALARDPGRVVGDARAAEARQLGSRAGSWLAGDAVIGLRWQDSAPVDRRGIRESEGGLDLPIWRLGQRDAAAAVAEGGRQQSEAEAQMRRLRVAGDVRETAWAVALARVRVAEAEQALAAARALEAVVDKRIAVGDQAPADALSARDYRLERESHLQDAQIVRVHAELSYRLLTGLDRLPAALTEAVAGARANDAPNPHLAMSEAQVQRARAEADLARRSRGGNPRLTVGARNEIGGDGRDIVSLGVGVSIPLGLSASARGPEAQAAVQAAQAESELALARRRYVYQQHEAEHEYEAAGRSRTRSRERAELARRELANAAKAFGVGEIGLAERLLIEIRARGALAEAATAELQYGLAIARFNQIQGQLPAAAAGAESPASPVADTNSGATP